MLATIVKNLLRFKVIYVKIQTDKKREKIWIVHRGHFQAPSFVRVFPYSAR